MNPTQTDTARELGDAGRCGRGAAPAPGGGGARPGAGPIRPSRSSPWRALVLLLVHVALALHIAHWYVTGSSVSPLEPSEAMEFSKEGIVNAGLVFFVLAIVATALFGRFFCGWGCHLIALQDGASWLLKKVGIRPRPLRSRALLFVPAAAFLYMFVWPLAWRLWIGYRPEGGVELTKADFWATFPPWPVALATFLVCGFAIIYFLGSKGFCTYACPYGAIFGLVDRVAPGRIRVTDACEGCGHCTAVCTSNVQVHAEVRDYGTVVDPGCMKCMDCVSVCPKDALYFGFGRPGVLTGPRAERPPHARGPRLVREKLRRWRDLSWREELALAALFAAALFAFRGLFGLVPFLMALGLGAILAWLALLGWRVLRGRDGRLAGLGLRAGGSLTGAGRAFLVAMGLVLGIWAYAGTVRWREWRADLAVARLDGPEPAEVAAHLDLASAGLAHARFVERWAPPILVPAAWRAQSAERLAWFERRLGQGEAFEREIRRALALAPGRGDWRLALAEHLGQTQRPAEARAELERVLGGPPGDPHQALATARLFLALGDAAGAERAFRAGLERSPDHGELLFDHGVLLAARGELEEAATRFRAVLARDPRALPALENLAGTLCALGRFEEGLERFEEALALAPDDPQTRLLAARAALELRDLERAELHARAASRLTPESPAPWLTLAHIARLQGDPAEAARLEQRARDATGNR